MLIAEAFLGMSNDAMVALAGAGGVIALLFRLLIASKDEVLASVLKERDRIVSELTAERNSAKEFGREALQSALDTANYYRSQQGKPPLIPVGAVAPPTNSPSTLKQRVADELGPHWATLALIKLHSAQEPLPDVAHDREEPPQAK